MKYLVLHNNRYNDLKLVMEGYQKFQMPLVGYDGVSAVPCKIDDDLGIYIFIPKIAKFLNLTLEQAIYLFFHGTLIVGLIIAATIFWHLYKNPLQRCLSFFGLLLFSYLPFRISDVYSFGSTCTLITVPLFLWISRQTVAMHAFISSLFGMGLIIGLANTARAYSGISTLIILLFNIIALEKKTTQKIWLISALLVGMLIPQYYAKYQCDQYLQFISRHEQKIPTLIKRHPFWHTFYLGFGFLNCMNSAGVQWSDTWGFEKVKSVNPDPDFYVYDNEGYQEIMKQNLLDVIKHHSFFVGVTIFAKIGVLLFYLIKYVNILLISLLWSLRRRLFYLPVIGWLLALCFNALYPIVAIPFVEYSVLFIASAILFAIIETNESINTYGFDLSFINLYRTAR